MEYLEFAIILPTCPIATGFFRGPEMIEKKYDGSEPSYLYQIGHNLQESFATIGDSEENLFTGWKVIPNCYGGAMERITWKVPIGWLQGGSDFPFGA
jgi:hypothetical protein